ncbi:TolC family protein [Rhizobiaceae sp. 2RAB30]
MDLLVDVLDAADRVRQLSPEEIRELLKEVAQVVGQILERDAAVEGVVSAVRSAIDRRNKARRMFTLAEVEKRSSATMLEGLRAERKVGERSTFDEIRAIENLANAELNLTQARYQLRAADYTLAAETGQMERLVSSVPVTEPVK